MLKLEDYDKENLIKCIVFLTEEIQTLKNRHNSSGFIKYCPWYRDFKEYRTKLKKLKQEMIDDLIVDFGMTAKEIYELENTKGNKC